MRSRSASDKTTLALLRQALRVIDVKPLPMIGTMTTSRIDIALAGGRRWEMYVLDDTRLTMHDVLQKKRSYSLDTNGDFVAVLRSQIEACTGDAVHLFYDREVEVTAEAHGRDVAGHGKSSAGSGRGR